MKIGFLLQRRFAYIGHALAALLNQKYGAQEFCGYVSMRDGFDFIKKQSSPRFTELLLDEDIHRRYKDEVLDWDFLKQLEKDYGLPNLWPYIEVDRIVRSGQLLRAYPYNKPLYSHEDMARIVQATAKTIIKFLDEAKPNVIIFSYIGSISSLLLYEIAKKRSIKILVIHHSRVGIKQNLSANYQNFSFVNDLFKKIQSGKEALPEERAQAIAFLEEFRQKLEPYCLLDLPKSRPVDRRRQFNFLLPKSLIKSIFFWLKMVARYLSDPYRDDFTNISPLWEMWDNFKKKIRVLVGFEKFYDEVNEKEDFAFFPLHREPELTTLLYAPFYKDQLWLIRQMARSLPLNFKLYIKEHPPMFGLRPHRFYKELKKIPNVKLVRPTVESLSLIKNAKLVFTISGTAGWEATQLKKPVIVFSNIFYTQLPMVKRCVAIEELPYLVKEQLENFRHDEEALINFLTAIFKESADVDLINIWQVEGVSKLEDRPDLMMPLVDLIAQKLDLKPLK